MQPDPLDYLNSLEFHGIKLGLDNINQLLKAAGNPQHAIPTVHVGGTNGKGSVIAFLDSIFRQAGYKTGRFTSPHLIHLNERFLVSGSPIPMTELKKYIAQYRDIAENLSITPTFFELNTAIAFQYFADQHVDIAFIEVGMGGRFDSTNVITPLTTVITNIGLDHTAYLGDTLEKIAFEKAGIIKPRVPLILGEQSPGPQRVILDIADSLHAPVRMLHREFDYQWEKNLFTYTSTLPHINDITLGLHGQYQASNAAIALATMESLLPTFPRIDTQAIRRGLTATQWPCRFETVHENPTIIIDVAHNAEAAHALEQALTSPAIFFIAIAKDKDANDILDALAPKAQSFILTQFDGHRAMPAEDLATACANDIPSTIHPNFTTALETGIQQARDTCIPLVIAGSLFTAGQARQYLMEKAMAPPLPF